MKNFFKIRNMLPWWETFLQRPSWCALWWCHTLWWWTGEGPQRSGCRLLSLTQPSLEQPTDEDEGGNMAKQSITCRHQTDDMQRVTFKLSLESGFLLTTLGGSLWPGRYFTFSWSVLMISVSLRLLIISSNTHMFTVVSNLSYLAALAPTILAMAEPLWTWRHTLIILLSRKGTERS